MRRLIAIALIWLGCALCWLVLGSTLLVRSDDSSSRMGDDVSALWGPPMRQLPPRTTNGHAVGPATPLIELPLVASAVDVRLALEHRKKGLVWFPTYAVDFGARYTFQNPSAEAQEALVELPLESANALYDGFEVSGDGGAVLAEVKDGVARWKARFAPGQKLAWDVRYRSRGTSRWQYDLTSGTGNVRDFRLSLATDFTQVEFLPGTLSPSSHGPSQAGGWSGTWQFKTLVASSPIGVSLPERLNPGPLASKITFFAPVSLLFFFFVVAILAHAQKKELVAIHYLFLGCAFFAFHLLFAYLVDHIAIGPAFALAAIVSVALVVTYARLFVGWKFALREMGVAQLLYLVLFSFTFFWTGFTGLAITIGAVLTLFVLMQITGRQKLTSPGDGPAHVCAAPYRCAAIKDARA
jgi:hypothetical protein